MWHEKREPNAPMVGQWNQISEMTSPNPSMFAFATIHVIRDVQHGGRGSVRAVRGSCWSIRAMIHSGCSAEVRLGSVRFASWTGANRFSSGRFVKMRFILESSGLFGAVRGGSSHPVRFASLWFNSDGSGGSSNLVWTVRCRTSVWFSFTIIGSVRAVRLGLAERAHRPRNTARAGSATHTRVHAYLLLFVAVVVPQKIQTCAIRSKSADGCASTWINE